MGIGDWGWDDVPAIVLDPSGSLLAVKKAAEEAAEAGERQKRDVDSRAARAWERLAPERGDSDVVSPCCNEYQLEGEFLINTRTGAVWKYDAQNNTFAFVPKKETDLQKAGWGLIFTMAANAASNAKAKELAKLHHSERKSLEEFFDNMVGLLTAKAKGFLPG